MVVTLKRARQSTRYDLNLLYEIVAKNRRRLIRSNYAKLERLQITRSSKTLVVGFRRRLSLKPTRLQTRLGRSARC